MAYAMAAGREASFENLIASVLPAAIAEGEPGAAPSVRKRHELNLGRLEDQSLWDMEWDPPWPKTKDDSREGLTPLLKGVHCPWNRCVFACLGKTPTE